MVDFRLMTMWVMTWGQDNIALQLKGDLDYIFVGFLTISLCFVMNAT